MPWCSTSPSSGLDPVAVAGLSEIVVEEEKTTRVSEVLLASLRPSELLLGKVAGMGALSIGQLALVAAPALVVAFALDAADLPDAAAGTTAWGLVWFVAG